MFRFTFVAHLSRTFKQLVQPFLIHITISPYCIVKAKLLKMTDNQIGKFNFLNKIHFLDMLLLLTLISFLLLFLWIFTWECGLIVVLLIALKIIIFIIDFDKLLCIFKTFEDTLNEDLLLLVLGVANKSTTKVLKVFLTRYTSYITLNGSNLNMYFNVDKSKCRCKYSSFSTSSTFKMKRLMIFYTSTLACFTVSTNS